jgi:anti-anti-sigma factor
MLKMNVEKLGNVTVLHLQGRIVTGVEANTLRKAVFVHPESGVILLDLAKVNGIDAGGLGALLELREWTQSKGIQFKLINVTRFVKRVFEMTCLDSVFEIWSGERATRAAA